MGGHSSTQRNESLHEETNNEQDTMAILSWNKLTEVPKFPDSLWTLTSLKILNYGGNNISTFPLQLNECLTNLEELGAQQNSIPSIPSSITKLKNLKTAVFSENLFTEVPNSLPSTLQLLNLSCNSLKTLPPSLGLELNSLTHLDLNENQISSIPEEFFNLSKLEKLFLECNDIVELPKDFHLKWTHLTQLNLSFNLLNKFPEEVYHLKKLVTVGVSGNPFLSLVNQEEEKKKFKESSFGINDDYPVADEVLPGLLLGCRECAKNRHALQSKKVTHVLTVAQYKPLYINHFKYKIVPVADANEEDLCQYFEDCVKFIDEARSAGGALVHCRHGVSRSATVTVAYVMAHKKMKWEEAYNLVQAARPRINPNDGFKDQLKKWQSVLEARDVYKDS